MVVYAVAAAGAVIICTAVLTPVFRKSVLFRPIKLLQVAAASLITIAAFPFLFSLIIYKAGNAADGSAASLAVGLSAVISALLALISAVLISTGGNKNAAAESAENVNYLENIYNEIIHEDSGICEHTGQISKNADIVSKVESNVEKSVDSSENIDKMGIEECIEQAFDRKSSGDLEGALELFSEVLDKDPGNELIFQIVLEICILYRELGQAELARDILNSYHETFGNVMDISVKEEIEKNLLAVEK